MSKELIVTSSLPALREAKRINDSHFARIWKFLYEPKREVKLTDFEEDMRKRLANVWHLLTGKILSDRKAVQSHLDWCKDNCLAITERTAYDDLRRAKALYGDPRLHAPAYDKARISAILLEQMEILKQQQDTGEASEKIEAAKALNQIIGRYNAVNGLEEDLQKHVPRAAITVVFNSDPDVLKQQAAELMEGIEDAEVIE